MLNFKCACSDLKPANVLIAGVDQSDMTAKVADFGESRRFDLKEAEARDNNNGGGDALTMVRGLVRAYNRLRRV